MPLLSAKDDIESTCRATLLGANPVEFIEHYTGDWTLRILLTTLAMTPLRMLTGLTEPIRVRRILGLWAFAFLCLRFLTYLVFDLSFSMTQLADDLVKRKYHPAGLHGLASAGSSGGDVHPGLAAATEAALDHAAPAHLSGRPAGRDPLSVAGQGRHPRTADLSILLALLAFGFLVALMSQWRARTSDKLRT